METALRTRVTVIEFRSYERSENIVIFFGAKSGDHKHCVTQVNVQAEAVVGEVAIHRHTLGSSVATIFF